MTMLPEWNLTIGEIVAPFGIAGEAKVRLETDFPERFSRLTQVCLRWPDGTARLCAVEKTRFHKGQILLKLRGIPTINEVEPLRGALVQVRSEEAVSLPANQFYIHDLIGCQVVLEEGKELGVLTSVLRSDANDVYVIHGADPKSEILLPAIREVVREVDLTRRRIVVTPTPGLMPGDAEEVK